MTTDLMVINEDQKNLIKATLARNCTDTEFQMLLYQASVLQLDPLRKQIWAVKFADQPALIFVGRDGYLQIAHRSGNFDGMESGTKKNEDGAVIGFAKVYRKDMSHPIYKEVLLSEYDKKQGNWKTMPMTMIQKVAESQALRAAFAISGVYSPEEFGEREPEQKDYFDAKVEEKKQKKIIEA
jgi:phage recombination protein Bet